ncbi:hypothetical protein CDIK_0645 [Cucumispora dikerogammari]|nr:hypothetical protein CDIK_0645 [Cucumispora dikerogammari]
MSYKQQKLNISLIYKPNLRLNEATTLAGFHITTPKLILTEDMSATNSITDQDGKNGDISDFYNYNLDEKTYEIFKKKRKFIADMVVQVNGKSKHDIIRYLYDHYES